MNNIIKTEARNEISGLVKDIMENMPEGLKNKYGCAVIVAVCVGGVAYQITDAIKAKMAMELGYDYSSSLFSSKITQTKIIAN